MFRRGSNSCVLNAYYTLEFRSQPAPRQGKVAIVRIRGVDRSNVTFDVMIVCSRLPVVLGRQWPTCAWGLRKTPAGPLQEVNTQLIRILLDKQSLPMAWAGFLVLVLCP